VKGGWHMDAFRIGIKVFIGLFLLAGIMFVIKADKYIDTRKKKNNKKENYYSNRIKKQGYVTLFKKPVLHIT
jgi:hypothetical protein